MHRRAFALSVPAVLGAKVAAAQPPAWPVRPIRMMVGFSAATTSDLLARLVAQRLSEGSEHPSWWRAGRRRC